MTSLVSIFCLCTLVITTAYAQQTVQKYGEPLDCAENLPVEWQLKFQINSQNNYARSSSTTFESGETGILQILPLGVTQRGVQQVESFELEISGGKATDSVFLLWDSREDPLSGKLRPELTYHETQSYALPLNERFTLYRWLPCKPNKGSNTSSQAGFAFRFYVKLCAAGERNFMFRLLDASGGHTAQSDIVCKIIKPGTSGSCIADEFDVCSWVDTLPLHYRWLRMYFRCT